jgi:hypothetical protein
MILERPWSVISVSRRNYRYIMADENDPIKDRMRRAGHSDR